MAPETTSTTTSKAAAPERDTDGRLRVFHPGLEGLRGLAVAAVLFFHGGFRWAQGGFLGVSTFFTLSGFLITSLLLAEREQTGSIGFRVFWMRRARRLLPAALAAIALACAYTALAGDALQKQHLVGDVLACLAYVANWRFLFSGQSYAALFGRPSALLHYWSLAIEEQFYLLFPLLCGLILVVVRGRRRALTSALGILLAASLAVVWWGHLSHDAIYFGTETRGAEILVGALLAVAVAGRSLQRLADCRDRLGASIAALGVVGLAATVACWVLVAQQTEWLYRGGFVLYAVGTATVVMAAIVGIGPVRWLLSSRPLRVLGLISYGVYLYHWPIFLWLSPQTTGLTETELFVPRVALTLAAAAASFVWLEQPVRRRRPLFGVRPAWLLAPAMVTLALVGLLVTTASPAPPIDFAGELHDLNSLSTTKTHGSDGSKVPVLAVYGDSTAVTLGLGLGRVLIDRSVAEVVPGGAQLGCALAQAPASLRGGEVMPLNPRCRWTEWKPYLSRHPDLVVVLYGPWDTAPTEMPGSTTYRTPGDPVYDAFLQKQMVAAVDVFAANGADVVWLTSPDIGPQAAADDNPNLSDLYNPDRMHALDRIVRQLPRLRPGKVQVVDLATWYASTKPDDRAMRPDGMHFTAQSAVQISEEWLAKAVMSAYYENRSGHQRPATQGASSGITTSTTATR
jgi:peptidoglycan/LPS O-acetylase OafA/YrhL